MISIIIPTYNVGEYVDRCLDSVVNQTYANFEVIIVDGNSTDDTLARVEAWLLKDSRLNLLHQKSKGLGPARDEGIAVSKGEYITFIDSDDWWDLTYLEKMFDSIEKNDSDISMCDRLNYHFYDDGRIACKYPMTKAIMQDPGNSFIDNPELLQMIEVSVNGKIFRKKLFIDNSIKTPNCAAEDRTIMHYLFYKARNISKVKEPLYFYHAERGGSLVNTIKAWSSLNVSLNAMHEYFERDINYSEELCGLLRSISIESVNMAEHSIRMAAKEGVDSDADELLRKIEEYHKIRYPDLFNKLYLIGSYGLRREVWLAYHSFGECRVHQQFSSIISLMSEPVNYKYDDEVLKDTNRKKWLKNDFDKSFLQVIKPASNEYIFLDFMEERFDIGKIGDRYFTVNDLFNEVAGSENDFDRIARVSPEADELFKAACDRLISILQEKVSPNHIILVRNRLSEKMGVYSGTTLFFNSDWIKTINEKLDEYYDYFINKCPGIVVIYPEENESFFSYEDFPFGCAPYHINDAFYHNVAYRIRNIICK